MTIEYIRYKVGVDQRENFVQAYRSASAQLDDSEYCTAYELSECEEEPGQYMLRIEWTSTQDHLEGFRKSPGFRTFYGHIKAFFSNIQEMRHYQVTEVVSRKKVKSQN
ncbi:antibiotic biosynthesis monooxygenase [Segetibacter sp. 3557_3]|uniref:putative quinol monooxygenase n=1 Tax=Segetibacter sp. 3557_3 TaxID=2547429 RepID=UPI001058A741|nr:antibiotic biosynthesis monooxygenase family protein [Segetibacter sp. 3557_3]TDH28639.1 antibiotic biosynthesis monooxygenase [Segetibacter sp. 3557_3]